jgi:hypothetical protein
MSAVTDRLFADIAMSAPGALRTAMDAELMATMRDFLQQTNIWQVGYEVSIVQNQRAYVLEPADGVAIKALLTLYDSEDIHQRWVAPASMPTPPNLLLQNAPSQSATWVALCSVYAVDATGVDYKDTIPGWIFDTYYEAIFRGALGRLQVQPGKPYSNAALGGANLRAYMSGRALARSTNDRKNTRGAQVWVYPQGGVANQGRQRGV